MTLSKLLKFSDSQFPHLQTGFTEITIGLANMFWFSHKMQKAEWIFGQPKLMTAHISDPHRGLWVWYCHQMLCPGDTGIFKACWYFSKIPLNQACLPERGVQAGSSKTTPGIQLLLDWIWVCWKGAKPIYWHQVAVKESTVFIYRVPTKENGQLMLRRP